MSEETKTPAQVVDAMTKDQILETIVKTSAIEGHPHFKNLQACCVQASLDCSREVAEEIIRRYSKE